MPNTNAFRPVVHEKIFWRFNKIFLILPLIGPQKGPAPLFEQIWTSPLNHVSHHVWLKLAKWFFRRSRLNGKVNRQTDRQTDGRTPDKLRWQYLTWAFGDYLPRIPLIVTYFVIVWFQSSQYLHCYSIDIYTSYKKTDTENYRFSVCR